MFASSFRNGIGGWTMRIIAWTHSLAAASYGRRPESISYNVTPTA